MSILNYFRGYFFLLLILVLACKPCDKSDLNDETKRQVSEYEKDYLQEAFGLNKNYYDLILVTENILLEAGVLSGKDIPAYIHFYENVINQNISTMHTLDSLQNAHPSLRTTIEYMASSWRRILVVHPMKIINKQENFNKYSTIVIRSLIADVLMQDSLKNSEMFNVLLTTFCSEEFRNSEKLRAAPLAIILGSIYFNNKNSAIETADL